MYYCFQIQLTLFSLANACLKFSLKYSYEKKLWGTKYCFGWLDKRRMGGGGGEGKGSMNRKPSEWQASVKTTKQCHSHFGTQVWSLVRFQIFNLFSPFSKLCDIEIFGYLHFTPQNLYLLWSLKYKILF